MNTNQVMLVFEERENRSTRRKPLGAEKRTNKLNPHMTLDLGIEPGPHWWEASALTTTPSLHICLLPSLLEEQEIEHNRFYSYITEFKLNLRGLECSLVSDHPLNNSGKAY